MKIRSYSWGAADLSWSVVIEELLHAAEAAGHQTSFVSTNGTTGMRYWNDSKVMQALLDERAAVKADSPFEIDLTFTVPNNFSQRFLKNSLAKLAITDYESHPVPSNWKQWCNIPDRILPGSQWVSDAMIAGGIPAERLAVVPHGVDLDLFNPGIAPFPIKTEKSFKFLCVAEPHYRKQIDLLLETYCNAFTSDEDVCLVLKTKLFRAGDVRKPYEQDIKAVLVKMVRKYGSKIPEIKLITNRLESIASLYTACQAFVLMTAAEGFGIPFLEALACGLVVIAPRFGGQLDFLNDQNSILCRTSWRPARAVEQYWGQTLGSEVGAPDQTEFAAAMKDVAKNYVAVRNRLAPAGLETASQFTWHEAWKKIVKVAKEISPNLEAV